MSAYELIEVALNATNRIDAQWALFISFHLAIFGAIIYLDRPLGAVEKAVPLLVYLVFAVFNYRLLGNQIGLLAALYSDVARLSSEACCASLAAVDFMASDLEGGRFRRSHGAALVIHVAMAAAVTLSVLFDRQLFARK